MTENRADGFKVVTAAVLIIGDEILSGRTKDKNLAYLAQRLGELGIQLKEARIISDDTAEIVGAVNELRRKFDYVFTSGGIGPTHDDITADSIAAAFGVSIGHHPQAMEILTEHYLESGIEFNDARKRMARIPDGATLIDNPISRAPGFQTKNVFTMAGVPAIMQAMFENIAPGLVGGDPVISRSVKANLPEGKIARDLGILQKRFTAVSMGSYPYFKQGDVGTNIVLRSADLDALDAAVDALMVVIKDLGALPGASS